MLRFPLAASRARRWLCLGGVILLLAILIAALSGSVSIPLERLGDILGSDPRDSDVQLWRTLLLELRLPRVLGSVLTGASLAVAGCVLQAVFRNPLAEPGLIGTSSGAALAAAMTMVFSASATLLPFSAFAGAMAFTALAWAIGGGRDSSRLLLAGVALNALAGSGLALCAYIGDEKALRSTTFWMMGSLSAINWQVLVWMIPLLGMVMSLFRLEVRALDALLLGEREAFHLGFAVKPLRRRLLILCALTVALSVAFCGVVGFVGLMAPHLARMILGPGHRRLMWGAALIGAMLVLLADSVARMIVTPAELPLGVVLSLVGAPFFLWLMQRQRRPQC